MKLRHVLLALALAVPFAVQAVDSPALIQKIDQMLATQKDLDPEILKEIQQLREDGEKAAKDGKEDKAVENLNQALFLLGAF